ncbi:smad nuclear-interacting protein 1 [Erpetoichthys calabaricus]|uniref:Smad nuclear interacting protein n=1 Tax=Erpetoichthys calabaricus TaxID=27687 RepID=A0A8C4SZS8_ERPCA|nr:smad nuclear-interacting protein 1 [Erpetoichthys calabaricus]
MEKEKIRRRPSPSPEIPVTKIKIKQEKLSPVRPKKPRRSSSVSDRGSESPPPRRRRHSRSPARRRDRSPRRSSRSPRNRRSRSPRFTDTKIKPEREEHPRIKNEWRHRDRSDASNDRRIKEESKTWHRGREDASDERRRNRDAHIFQQQQKERERNNERRREKRNREEDNLENVEFGDDGEKDENSTNKELPNFELSGALVEDTNTYRGVVIKYNEPPEARIPKRRWRLYPFKNDEPLPVMYIHRQSAYLFGRQRRIADIPIDHPSCSKQHAVFQYRLVEFTRSDGTVGRRVKPYIIDLGSGNGTFLNNQRIDPQRYYEMKEKDVLKFGFSSREYVLLHEASDTSEVDKKEDDDYEDDE